MKELFSLGMIYPSDFLRDDESPRCEKVELKLIMDDDGLVRLKDIAPFDKMYGKYFYRSGINYSMRNALQDIVLSILKAQTLNEDDIFLDIACNDGTLLSYVPSYCSRIGIDPAEDSYRNEALNHCNFHVQDFFSKENYYKATHRKAKVVTSIAMFYDVPDPKKFIKDVYDILEDDGLWVMQLSYSHMMIGQNAFDNICHEHIYYYSCSDLRRLLNKCGFKIVDVELNEVNGGSFRLYIKKGEQGHDLISPSDFRVYSIFEFEDQFPLDYIHWFDEIKTLKQTTVDFIKYQKSQGKTIWAYGASTKGNTLLQYFGLDNTLIDAIAERNPTKYGLRTIGSNIPIKSEEEMREAHPDYLLILPWHFKNEFIEREKEYLNKGGKMIFPCPTFEIINK